MGWSWSRLEEGCVKQPLASIWDSVGGGSHAMAHRQPHLPRADPPRDVSVSTFLENRSGQVGIVLCTADSHPASTIALYHRGQLLASSLAPATARGVRASPSHNSLRVELGAVGPEDSGEYTCVVGNRLGNATASAYFDVRSEWGCPPASPGGCCAWGSGARWG